MIAPAGQRDVAAIVLLNTYSHIRVAELILDGTPPHDASAGCCEWYYEVALPAYVMNLQLYRPVPADVASIVQATVAQATAAAWPAGHTAAAARDARPVPNIGPDRHWTSACFLAALDDDKLSLAAPLDALRARHGNIPHATISATTYAGLSWQIEMMRFAATGAGQLTHCARVAHDRANGRPARRRKPADPAWLTGEVDATLTATWQAILDARQPAVGPFWRHPAYPRPDFDPLHPARRERPGR